MLLLIDTLIGPIFFSANKLRNLNASVNRSARCSVEKRIESVFFVFFFIMIMNSLAAFGLGPILMNSSYGHWIKQCVSISRLQSCQTQTVTNTHTLANEIISLSRPLQTDEIVLQ